MATTYAFVYGFRCFGLFTRLDISKRPLLGQKLWSSWNFEVVDSSNAQCRPFNSRIGYIFLGSLTKKILELNHSQTMTLTGVASTPSEK